MDMKLICHQNFLERMAVEPATLNFTQPRKSQRRHNFRDNYLTYIKLWFFNHFLIKFGMSDLITHVLNRIYYRSQIMKRIIKKLTLKNKYDPWNELRSTVISLRLFFLRKLCNWAFNHKKVKNQKQILTVNVTDIKSLNFWDALKDVYVRLIEVD